MLAVVLSLGEPDLGLDFGSIESFDVAQLHDAVLADRYGIDSCIECGICSYVCPSKLPLLASIREMRRRENMKT